jgi:hypothetical protein
MALKSSEKFSLNWHDLLRGSIMAFLTAFLTAFLQYLQTGGFPDKSELVTAAMAGIAALVGYLLKNYLSAPTIPPQDQ